MVVLNRIYTRTGDGGDTSLGSGERRKKYDLRVETYGTVDETNAVIGVARTAMSATQSEVDAILQRVQNDLFDLGADLCTPETDQPPEFEPLRITQGQVDRLEEEIDRLNSPLQPLRSFVLPGGAPASAHLHVARTVCRRAERLMVRLAEEERIGKPAIQYINRLSDLLFVAARYLNDHGNADVLWTPGQNRR